MVAIYITYCFTTYTPVPFVGGIIGEPEGPGALMAWSYKPQTVPLHLMSPINSKGTIYKGLIALERVVNWVLYTYSTIAMLLLLQ